MNCMRKSFEYYLSLIIHFNSVTTFIWDIKVHSFDLRSLGENIAFSYVFYFLIILYYYNELCMHAEGEGLYCNWKFKLLFFNPEFFLNTVTSYSDFCF